MGPGPGHYASTASLSMGAALGEAEVKGSQEWAVREKASG